jgi:hypothetical protein
MLWVEPPGNDELGGLRTATGTPTVAVRQVNAIARVQDEAALKMTADPGAFLLNGVADVSYSFHHPTVLGVPRTRANWDEQFGDLVKDDELSVNDGEWATRSQYTGFWAANGDSGPCWSDARAAVPRYFAYLQQLGVGMTAWTLSDGEPAMGATSASDPGTFTTTATMTGWPGCVNVRGPGALIMAWFAGRRVRNDLVHIELMRAGSRLNLHLWGCIWAGFPMNLGSGRETSSGPRPPNPLPIRRRWRPSRPRCGPGGCGAGC